MRPPTTLGFLAGQSLRLSEKWVIPADLIEWNSSTKALTLYLRPAPEVQWQCALCEEECPVYDTRAKAWRHLNMWSVSYTHLDVYKRQAQVVELRFLSGLTEVEVAEYLSRSERWVRDQWKFGRAWLRSEMA